MSLQVVKCLYRNPTEDGQNKSLGQKGIKVLKKAKQLDPRSPDPYKYLAMLYVDMLYRYKQAIRKLEKYAHRRAEEVFGRNYLGYL